jgi:hypothetical protein
MNDHRGNKSPPKSTFHCDISVFKNDVQIFFIDLGRQAPLLERTDRSRPLFPPLIAVAPRSRPRLPFRGPDVPALAFQF